MDVHEKTVGARFVFYIISPHRRLPPNGGGGGAVRCAPEYNLYLHGPRGPACRSRAGTTTTASYNKYRQEGGGGAQKGKKRKTKYASTAETTRFSEKIINYTDARALRCVILLKCVYFIETQLVYEE